MVIVAGVAIVLVLGVAGTQVLAVARPVLHISRTMFVDASEKEAVEPSGHVVQMTGWMPLRLLLTQVVGQYDNTLMPLVEGKELKRSGFYYAGLQDELIFVRVKNTLQIQREVRFEGKRTPERREPLFTMYVPSYVQIQFDTN